MLRNKYFFGTRWLLLPITLLSVLAVAGLVQAQVGPPRGSARFEQWVSQEVNHQLVMLPWYSVFDNLQYKVKGSEVTLQGQVGTGTV